MPGAKSVLIAVEASDQQTIYPAPVEPSGYLLGLPVEEGAGAVLTALYQPWSLAELQLEAARPIAHNSREATRSVPVPLAVHRIEVDAEDARWQPDVETSEWIQRATLPALDLVRCAQEGGCLMSREQQAIACTLPCPAPEAPDPPAEAEVLAVPLVPPTAPEPPSFLPCPPGWAEVPTSSLAISTCEPPPVPARVPCAIDEAQFFGGSGCARVGTSCPAGDFLPPTELPLGRPVLYARRNVSPGGDGSLAAPFDNLPAALAAASPGTVIALAKETYAGRIVIPAGVTLIGACPRDTVIEEVNCCDATIRAGGPNVALQNLRVVSAEVAVLADPGPVQLTDVVLEAPGPRGWGVVARNGGAVTGSGVVIRGQGDEAINANQAGRITLSRTVVEWAPYAVLAQHSGSSIQLQQTAIRDRPGSAFLTQVQAVQGARLDLAGISIDRPHGVGLVISEVATASITDLVFADTLDETSSGDGGGLYVGSGARVGVERAYLVGNRGPQIYVEGALTDLSLSDAVLRNGVAEPDGGIGGGVFVGEGSRAQIRRVLIERNAGPGLRVAARAQASLSDALVRGQRWPVPGVPSGQGALVEGEARVDIERVIVQDNDRAGIEVHSGAFASMRDVSIVGQRVVDPNDAGSGVGLSANGHASLEAHRVITRANARAGVRLAATTATLTDVHLSENGGRGTDEVGLFVVAEARLIARSVQVEGEGVVVAGPISRLVLSEAALLGTPQRPASLNVLDGSFLSATRMVIRSRSNPNIWVEGARASITDTVIAGDTGGIVVQAGGQADLERLLIEGARIGLRVQRSGVEARDLILRGTTLMGVLAEIDSSATLARVKIEANEGVGVRVRDQSQLDIQHLTEIGTTSIARGGHVDAGSTLLSSHFLIEGNEGYGLEGAATASGLDLTDGEIARNIAAFVGLVPADLSCCLVRVRYRDNGSLLR